ncbi:MAG: hypothetical protein JO250_18760 [Armatimonadetes bacterium]|nr:hypothetical protein [Armatimonadota bacterium]
MKTAPLDNTITTALHTILSYLESERDDYEATPLAERGNHIYHSVKIIADWLTVYRS